MEAAQQLEHESGDGDLQQRLANAGLVNDPANVDNILERLRGPQRAVIVDASAATPDQQKLLAAESLFGERK